MTEERSLCVWNKPRHWGRIRSVQAISISLLLFGCQHHHKESSLLDCAAGSADTGRQERRGSGRTWTSERERAKDCCLNAISRHWKRSDLQRSLMYGLIWASTVLSVCFTGLEFTKLMTQKAQKSLCFMSLLDCGRIQKVQFHALFFSKKVARQQFQCQNPSQSTLDVTVEQQTTRSIVLSNNIV